MRSFDSTSVYFDIKKKEKVTVIGDSLRRILKGKCTSTLWLKYLVGIDKVMCGESIFLDQKYYLINTLQKSRLYKFCSLLKILMTFQINLK